VNWIDANGMSCHESLGNKLCELIDYIGEHSQVTLSATYGTRNPSGPGAGVQTTITITRDGIYAYVGAGSVKGRSFTLTAAPRTASDTFEGVVARGSVNVGRGVGVSVSNTSSPGGSSNTNVGIGVGLGNSVSATLGYQQKIVSF